MYTFRNLWRACPCDTWSLRKAPFRFDKRWGSTIYALSSAHGKCGVSLIRVSGPSSMDALQALTGKSKHDERKATLNKLVDPVSGVVLDHAITVWFPAPRSFTGEDSAELQVHGGTAVVRSVWYR